MLPHYPSLSHGQPQSDPAIVGTTVSPGSFYTDVNESFTLVEVQSPRTRV